jgi:hypothetical protein
MTHHSQPGHAETPEDLRDLDRILRQVRFHPRGSLGAELIGRLRRGEQPSLGKPPGFVRTWLRPLVAGLVAMIAVLLLLPRGHVTVDRCCFDLDGGGTADDGALVVGERDGRLSRLLVYEDRDGTASLTPADIMRYDRRGSPAAVPLPTADQTRIQHCCEDLDGGGPADDGIIVFATPPDRVHTAAIYQLR